MSQPPVLLEACAECGQSLPPVRPGSSICAGCEQDLDAEGASQSYQYLVDVAGACRCGGWKLTSQGEPYQVADCVCGA